MLIQTTSITFERRAVRASREPRLPHFASSDARATRDMRPASHHLALEYRVCWPSFASFSVLEKTDRHEQSLIYWPFWLA